MWHDQFIQLLVKCPFETSGFYFFSGQVSSTPTAVLPSMYISLNSGHFVTNFGIFRTFRCGKIFPHAYS